MAKQKYLGYASTKKEILKKKIQASKKGYGYLKIKNLGYGSGSKNYSLFGRKLKKKK